MDQTRQVLYLKISIGIYMYIGILDYQTIFFFYLKKSFDISKTDAEHTNFSGV